MIQPNLLLISFLTLFLFRSGTQLFLNRLNISHLHKHGKRVPEPFQDTIDQEKFKKISAYTAESAHFGIIGTLADQGLLLVILLSGFLPRLVGMISQWAMGPILGGLVFFATFGVLTLLFHIPFNLYDTFVIEDRYGFNTKTLRIWIFDLMKEVAISAILGGLLLGLLLYLIAYGGKAWWVWAWMLVGLFELLMIWLFPIAIAPLFNKFEPIDDPALEHEIRSLSEKAGLLVKGILKMDASKRSKHTNAYFTGIGRSKRIVLFDTLLRSHTKEEVLAVLAHEIGHWKKKHVLKSLILTEILSWIGFYIGARCLVWPRLYQTFGFTEPVAYAGLFLIGIFLGVVTFFVQPLESAISRKFEREADDFVLDLTGTPEPMCKALKRLAADNLANLIPHPLYAYFYYSHPPLIQRIERLQPNVSKSLSNQV